MLPLDLHVLGMPPAFNLSQDQTLQAPYAAAASAALILWHAARDKPASIVNAPAPLVYPNSIATRSQPAVAPAAPAAETNVPIAAQQAGVASTIEVVVGRNDTMDAFLDEWPWTNRISRRFATCLVFVRAWIS
jgi:hypothetical protein